jgi:hypothetical protein
VSYNIGSWKRIAGEPLRISRENAELLSRTIGRDVIDGWFVDRLRFDDGGYSVVDGSIVRGEGSGTLYHGHLGDVVACLEGSADFVLTWENGDSITGLRVADGKAIEMDVVFALKDGGRAGSATQNGVEDLVAGFGMSMRRGPAGAGKQSVDGSSMVGAVRELHRASCGYARPGDQCDCPPF